jgi:hypothetical protein
MSEYKSSTSTAPSQSTTEGIQKPDNEWGVWGGISFDAPTLIGKTPTAHYRQIGLCYGRVLAALKSVSFEWTIDAIPLAILSTERPFVVSSMPFVVGSTRKAVYGTGAFNPGVDVQMIFAAFSVFK